MTVPSPLEIREALPGERTAALAILIPGLSGAPQEAALESLANGPGSPLFVAVREGKLVGAVWLQPQESGVTFVTGPQLAEGEPEASCPPLLRRALDTLDAQKSSLAQSLTESAESPAAIGLRGAGFEEVAVLLYLVSLRESFPKEEPCGDFDLEAYGENGAARLAALLEQTYIGTLDCRDINDDRSPHDAIQGYLATGNSAGRWWRFVRAADCDVGCLLLGDFPNFQQLELIYVGLIPEVRGHGFGRELVRWTQWLAGSLGRERLVCAVDEANAPAVAMYAANDFHVWQRRHVWLRKRGEN